MLAEALRVRGLGDHDVAGPEVPAEDHLRGGRPVLLRQSSHGS
jgi:hypothetical protein